MFKKANYLLPKRVDLEIIRRYFKLKLFVNNKA
nr:MAG TPA: hypothetical protein [Caudoviricetes sp.]